MRIREICFQDFRSFRGRQVVSFVDPTTGDVRPVSVIVGSDDAAKRTVLEAIDALLSYAIDPRHPRPLVEEAHDAGWIQMGLELTPADLEQFHRMAGALAERPRETALRAMAVEWSPWRTVAAGMLWHYYHHIKSREGTT